MIIRQTLGSLAFLCTIGACGGAATAQVTPKPEVFFDNFGPGNSYSTTSGFPFGAFGAGQVAHAMAFTADNPYLLTAGEFGIGLIVPGPSTFEITVHADDGDGLPGAVLEEVTVSEQLGSFSSINELVGVEFAGTTLLDAGEQYWISMSSDAPTLFGWNQNNIGDLGPHAVLVDDGDWKLEDEADQRGAFRLYGTPVPAPGAIGLLGAFAYAARRRRKVA